MFKKYSKQLAVIAALGLAVSFTGAQARADVSVVDNTAPMVGILHSCQTDTELDCIESVGVVADDGTVTQLKDDGLSSFGTFQDTNGNTIQNGQENYSGPGVSVGAKVELESLGHIIGANPLHTGSAMRAYIQGLNAGDRTKFQMSIRTSWLQAEDIQLLADSANYAIEPIAGGTRWTFQGKQQSIGGYTGSDWQAKMTADANADEVWQRLAFFVHNTGTSTDTSYFDPKCASAGYPVRTFNAPAAGLPYWDGSALNFGIWSPHADPTGTPFMGYFKLWVPDAFIDCMYPGNTITTAPSVVASVVDADGYAQDASVQVSNENGQLYLAVSGFHYSSPHISVRSVNAPAPLPKPKPKTTITCMKGSKAKKVTAISPKCPAGYKLAKTIKCVKGSRVKSVTSVNPRCPAGYRKKS